MMKAMSFSDTIFLFFLVLVLFGPKKLPEMARQAGKLMAELRRASNEFRSQIDAEIAHLEVEKKQTVLPPTPPPPGAVASINPNSAVIDSATSQPPSANAASEATLAATPAAAPSAEAPAETAAPPSQESHV